MRGYVKIGFLFCALAQMGWAQPVDPAVIDDYKDFRRARILKINLFSPLAEVFTMAYESVLTPEKSIQLTVSLVAEGGFIVTPEFRYYLSEMYAPRGVYVAPFLRYFQIDDQGLLGGGLIIGKQGLYKNKITINGFLGPSINTVNLFEDNDVFFGLRAGITLGINLARKQ